MTKDRIEKLIAKGELKTALDELLAWTKGKEELSDTYNASLLISGRLAELERKKIIGELDHKEVVQAENQICSAIFSTALQVPASAWDIDSSSTAPNLSRLRTDPLLLDFVKKHGDAYDHDHALFTDFWAEMQQKYGVVRERDLLTILGDVYLALQEISSLAARFVAQHAGKWRTVQWVDFKDGIEEKYGAVMGVKELVALVEEKKRSFEEMLKDFVWIKGGEFMMGAVEDDTYATRREKPQHKVRLSSFYMGKYTVTLGQFAEFVKETGYQTDADKGGSSYIQTERSYYEEENDVNWRCDISGEPQNDQKHPVIHVSWNDAIAFCSHWNQKYGFDPSYDNQGNLLNADGKPTNQLDQVFGFRLPSDAEWEYACRASTTTLLYTGDTLTKEQANIGLSVGRTQPVGCYPANPWGLYDMEGNVSEWCQDIYDEQFYAECQKQGIVKNPLNSGHENRVLRGSSWDLGSEICHSSFRYSDHPASRCFRIGFRIVLFLPPGT